MEEDTLLASMREIHISMQEGTLLVCRKTGKTGEDRGRQ